MGKADIYIFLFFVQPEDVLNLRINFNEFQSIYAYKKVFTYLSQFKKERHLLEEGSTNNVFQELYFEMLNFLIIGELL